MDKQTLRSIVTLFFKHTGVHVRESALRYTPEEMRRQLTFGGDFVYGFGDIFKLAFVRSGTKRNEKGGKYDVLFRLAVELDNASGLRKDDELYLIRRKTADETEDRLEEYLKEHGLAAEP
jgi:hypothetical protein